MLILVFGSDGALGEYLVPYLVKQHYTTIGITKADFLVDESTTEDKIRSYLEAQSKKYRDVELIIINCIECSEDKKEKDSYFYLINSVFALSLAKVCEENLSWTCFHISTPKIFSGLNCARYCEFDTPDPQTVYSKSKFRGEDKKRAAIIRVDLLGRKFIESLQNKEVIKGYTNCFSNPVTCLEFCKIMHQLIANRVRWKGIKHISPEYSLSDFVIRSTINDVYEIGAHMHPTTISTFSNFVLASKIQLFYNPMYVNIPFDLYVSTIQKQLEEMKNFTTTITTEIS